MTRDLHRLKVTFERHDAVKTYHMFQTLITVFEQQCEIAETTTVPETITVDGPESKNDFDPGSGEKSSDHLTSRTENPSDPKIENL